MRRQSLGRSLPAKECDALDTQAQRFRTIAPRESRLRSYLLTAFWAANTGRGFHRWKTLSTDIVVASAFESVAGVKEGIARRPLRETRRCNAGRLEPWSGDV